MKYFLGFSIFVIALVKGLYLICSIESVKGTVGVGVGVGKKARRFRFFEFRVEVVIALTDRE